MSKTNFVRVACAVAAAAFSSTCLSTQEAAARAAPDFPVKPIRFVVGFSAGGLTDVIARIIAQDMSVRSQR